MPSQSPSEPDPAEAGLGPGDPVPDEIWLYRLIPIELCDPIPGGWEFRSGAFGNSTEAGFENEMSVVLGDTLAFHQRIPEDLPDFSYPDKPDKWGVAKVLTETVRTVVGDQEVIRSPNDDEPAHGDVNGPKAPKRRKRIKKNATWVIEPAAAATDAQ